ncbi:hypothetical protein KGQ24_02220, partial [Patescibacteria group bacterium]|nr:hypothetical protein [Patescibacteria group bacterium]
KAYRHTKNHKFLWFFGLFLSGWGTMNFVRRVDFDVDRLHSRYLHWLRFASNHPQNFIFVVIGILLAAFLLSALATIARATIIGSAYRVEQNKIATLSSAVKQANKHFWPVFWVGLFFEIAMLVIFCWLAVPLWFVFQQGSMSRGIVVLILALGIFVPIIIALSLINIFSACFVVIYDLKPIEAIKSGFDFFAVNWLQCMEIFVILFIIYFSLFFFSASLLGLLGLLAYGLAILVKSLSLAFFFVILSVFITAISLALLGINAVLNVFTNFAWTLLFLDLVRGHGKELGGNLHRSRASAENEGG